MDREIFNGLNEDEKNSFFNIFKQKKIKKDEIIKSEEQILEKAFFLSEGVLDIQKKSSDEDMQVNNIKAEEDVFFSLTCMLDGGKSLTTVIAKEDSTILEITKKEFFNFCKTNPEIGLKILQNITLMLCKIIRKNDDKISEMYKTLEEVL